MNTLPQAIADYIEAANAHAPTRVAACFHTDGTVLDEGNVRRGRDEIEAWSADTAERYGATIEPIGLAEADGRHMLRADVRGDFPGSPVTLAFNFLLQAGSIRSLEIKP
ncbi:MAG TPA: nuclear transport factor 2 family protein [Duganella sp.]|nr:nuclear transport factor 2 family protein [Duganella sp.]